MRKAILTACAAAATAAAVIIPGAAASASTTVKTVTISRDLGSLVEIGSGLNAGDRVVANPPDGITSGDEVRIAGEPGAKGAPDTASAKQPGG